MRTNATTWVALLLLTFASYAAGARLHPPDAAVLLLALAGAKCATLAWRFMELRAAHRLWPVVLVALLSAVLIAIRRFSA